MSEHHHHNQGHTHEHHHHQQGAAAFVTPAISFVLLVVGMLLNHFSVSWFAENAAVELAWYIVAFLPVGLPVIHEAWEGLLAHDWFNEFTLMVIACIGAFCIGEYPEAVGVMLFYSIGETLQHGAVDRATSDISRLLDVRSEYAHLVKGDSVETVDPKSVAVGDVIEIHPGERVPLDGVMLSSTALFDTSALTGESIPRDISKGGEVLAGMISSNSSVRIRVSKVYGQSTLARILELVSKAASRKAHAEQFITRFAHIYTPVVIALAALVVIVPWIVSMVDAGFVYDFATWLYRALVFLVISCPCALVISVPLGYFAGIGAASRAGILFKGGNYLEAMTKVNKIAFDKTGTLTTGKFSVTKVMSASSDSDNLLSVIASAERNSSHPLAVAIVEYAIANGITLSEASDMKEIPGFGVSAVIEGQDVLAGNLKLLDREKIAYPSDIDCESGTIIACSIDGQFAGYIILADTLKPTSAQAVEDLHRLGINDLVMLSGDKRQIVDEYASKLGISEAYGELLPQDKVAFVEKTAAERGRYIAFVGDGMNDAPVLAVSNVGIAMGGLGADAAIESADVVIHTDDPDKVATAIRIGRTTHTIVTENIVGAITIKVVILALGAMGYASLWAAVFADVGVALLAVLNSMRILFKNK